MPRVLGEETSKVLFTDNLSGTEIELHYRLPSAKERLGFQNESVVRKGTKIEFRQAETRLKYGMAILTGFRAGDFLVLIDGKETPLTTEMSDWRSRIREYASDMVELLAALVFERSANVPPVNIEDQDEDGADEEDAEKN